MVAPPHEKKIRLAIVQRYLPHYRTPLFDGLAAMPSLDVTVYCHPLTSPLPDVGIPFPAHGKSYIRPAPLSTFHVFGREFAYQWRAVVAATTGGYDAVVVEGQTSILSTLAILCLRRLMHRPTVLWLKGYFKELSPFTGVSGLVRKIMIRMADHVLCYGKTTAAQCLALGIERKAVTVLRNTVDTSELIELSARRLSSDGIAKGGIGAVRILSLGRLSPDKKIHLVISALKRVLAEYPLVTFDIAGDGTESAALQKMARDLGIIGNIRFHGTISETRAMNLLLAADIFVAPGAVGLSINLAMAAGCAVIVGDELGPDAEWVEDGLTGLRVKDATEAAWAAAIKLMATNDQLRLQYGMAGRKSIVDNGTMKLMVGRFADGIRASTSATKV